MLCVRECGTRSAQCAASKRSPKQEQCIRDPATGGQPFAPSIPGFWSSVYATTMSMITYLARQHRSNLLCLTQRLVASRCWQSTQPAAAAAEGSGSPSPSDLPFVSTGIHYGRYPHEDLREIHKRTSKIEDPKYERRRRIHLVKIVAAIGVVAVLFFSFYAFMLYWGFAEDWNP